MTDNQAVATGTPHTTATVGSPPRRGALHATDGLLILGIAACLYVQSRQRHAQVSP
jgi:hypothetical protein